MSFQYRNPLFKLNLLLLGFLSLLSNSSPHRSHFILVRGMYYIKPFSYDYAHKYLFMRWISLLVFAADLIWAWIRNVDFIARDLDFFLELVDHGCSVLFALYDCQDCFVIVGVFECRFNSHLLKWCKWKIGLIYIRHRAEILMIRRVLFFIFWKEEDSFQCLSS